MKKVTKKKIFILKKKILDKPKKDQPPKNNITLTVQTLIIFKYSAKKKKPKVIAEYSTL